MRSLLGLAGLLALTACVSPRAADQAAGPVSVRIIAFNDFHGALEPPRQAVQAPVEGVAEPARVPAGGAAYLASALQQLRAGNPDNITVSAGDMIGASPLVSSMFLDEPTIHAMNMMRVDYNAVGNHEFDRGRAELLRMQRGGCEPHTASRPCQLEPFTGARFTFLAANVRTGDGGTLFPPYAIRGFGSGESEVRVAFIGLTLRDTPTLVTPAGVQGLEFLEEATTINALVPELRRQGADAIVVLIHLGSSQPGPRFVTRTAQRLPAPSCGTMEGDLMPVLARLDPAIDLVVSGHTHNSYICDYATVDPSRPFFVTSAGRSGMLLTNIELAVDPKRGVVGRQAENVIVQGEAYRGSSGEVPVSELFPVYAPDAEVAALVERYAAAAAPLAERVVGYLTGPAAREATAAGETVAGDLVADAQLAATSGPDAGGAQIAFMNASGVRADIVPGPDGAVTYGQLYATQPFGNNIVVKSYTGSQVRRILEQQFASGWNTVERPNMLLPSRGLTYSYDLRRPEGQRILNLELNGEPIRDEATYRVTMNSFLASGGDNFTAFREGRDPLGGPQDLDAMERYIAAEGRLAPPVANRITRLDPPS
ncbi:MAG: bifunctional metallophosphatase/5'-nucleotidase [Allosphingosinicella sp.]